MAQEASKALLFTIRILKKGNSCTKGLAYRSLVRPILEYMAACWDLFREGLIKALDRVQNLQIYERFELGNVGEV